MNFLYDIGITLARAGLLTVSPFSQKMRQTLRGRVGLVERVKQLKISWGNRPVLWFHLASAGEFEQALAVIDAVRLRDPRYAVFVSYFSPSAERAVAAEARRRSHAGLAIPWDGADYSPWDTSRSVEAFLESLRPEQLVCVHREIWPAMIEGCHRRKIPVALVAAHFSRRPSDAFGLITRSLGRLSWVATVDGASRDIFTTWIRHVPTFSMGDPRCDRVLSRKEMQQTAPWAFLFSGQKLFVWASLWPRELDHLEHALCQLLLESRGWRFVLVPHEPTGAFVQQLAKLVQSTGRTVRTWSTWLRSPDTQSDLIVDTVGDLAELYRVCQMAYVGGSFRRKVHNVLEPAAWGVPIVVGPHIQNSSEAISLAKSGGGLELANDASEFLRICRRWLRDDAVRIAAGKSAQQFVEQSRGAAAQIAEKIVGGAVSV